MSVQQDQPNINVTAKLVGWISWIIKLIARDREARVKSVTGGHHASIICMNTFMSDGSHVIRIQLREHHLALMCL